MKFYVIYANLWRWSWSAGGEQPVGEAVDPSRQFA